MKNFIQILIAVILTHQVSFSQERFGIKAEGGMSLVTTNVDELFSNEANFTNSWTPSFNIGIRYFDQFSEHSTLSVELKFSYIRTTYGEDFVFTDANGIPIGEDEFKAVLRFSYISLPISYSFRIGNFYPSVGFRLSMLLNDRITYYVPEQIENIPGVYHEAINSDQFDFGPQIGLGYDLNDHFHIDATYYHGVANLENWDTGDFDLVWNSRQAVIGVTYFFGKSDQD